MTFYLILHIASQCPGGWFSGLIPSQARPLVCSSKPEHSITTTLPDAERMVRKLGPGVRLFVCNEQACKEKRIWWSNVADIEK